MFRLVTLLSCGFFSSVVSVGVGTDTDPFLKWFEEGDKEIIDEAMTVEVEGSIPSYINGKLFRTGPAVSTTPTKNFTNYIDAFGRLTAWTIDGNSNSVQFQSTMLKTNLYNHTQEHGEIPRHLTQEKTEPSTRSGLVDFNDMDNTDVIMYQFPTDKDRLLMFTDFYVMNEIHTPTLRSLGSVVHPPEDEAPDQILFSCSHASEYVEPSGEVVLVNWLGKKTARGSELFIFKMGSDMIRRMIGSFQLDFVAYSIHSVAVVNDFVVLTIGPVSIDFLKSGASLCLSCSTNDNIAKGTTQIVVFSLKSVDYIDTGKDTPPVAVYDINAPHAFFTFHYLNSFAYTPDDDAEETVIVLDMCTYSTMEGVVGEHPLGNLKDLSDKALRDSFPGFCDDLKRVEVSVKGKKVLKNVNLPLIDNSGNKIRSELSTVNSKYTSPNPQEKNCIGYGLTYHANGSPRFEDVGLIKFDTCKALDLATNRNSGVTFTTTVWHQENIYTGEPIFVANPTGTEEDDGTLLVVSKDGDSGDTNLLFIDAKTMTKLAQVRAPFPLMFEFHGRFFSNSRN